MNDLRATNFLPLSIAFHKIDRNPDFFRQIYKRDSYTDAAYAFANHQNELLQEMEYYTLGIRGERHTEKKVRSFISRFNTLVHRALLTHPTHSDVLVIILGFAGLINSIEDSKIVADVKPLLREYVDYFFLPYVKQVKPYCIDRRFGDFIRRIESMKTPQQIQDTISGFLEMQRAKIALVATEENSWLVSEMLPKGDLNILHGKCKQKINKFERFTLIRQLNSTGNKFPELRLGQLISNSLPKGTDIFYVTDAKLIQLLKDFEGQHELS